MDNEQTPALREAVENMANMREAYDNLSQAAEAYNVGKTQLAEAITGKGVETSPTESYPEMAEKVNAISQETYEINGGEMYAKQLFGSLETPNYWNLYDIMAQLLSDGRLVNYGGILLAEYYKGYDSIALSGAGTGGAYVVSDKDEHGNFKMYTEDTTHVWDTEFDGKGNRWVAYCFADEYHDFQITNTNTSPRSIHIGRHVGVIESLVNSRISEIVVTDGNKLKSFTSQTNSITNNFGKSVVLRNIEEVGDHMLVVGNSTIEQVYIGVDDASEYKNIIRSTSIDANVVNSVIIKVAGLEFAAMIFQVKITNLMIYAESFVSYNTGNSKFLMDYSLVENLYLVGIEEWFGYMRGSGGTNFGVQKKLYLAYSTNDKTRAVNISGYAMANATDVELKDGWCKPLAITPFTGLTKANVQAHIFDRLAVNDLSTGAVTITLANAVLNLFTQEEIDAVVERTNITIVGA